MEQLKRETKKPTIIENLKSGAIAIGKQESILAAIKADSEFCELTDQNMRSAWKDSSIPLDRKSQKLTILSTQ